MSNDDEFQKEVKKRVLELEKIAKEIFNQIELLKLLLTDSQVSAPKEPEIISMETPRKTEETPPPDCLHYFGYLRFLPKNDSIPDECLSCKRVIECFKHKR